MYDSQSNWCREELKKTNKKLSQKILIEIKHKIWKKRRKNQTLFPFVKQHKMFPSSHSWFPLPFMYVISVIIIYYVFIFLSLHWFSLDLPYTPLEHFWPYQIFFLFLLLKGEESRRTKEINEVIHQADEKKKKVKGCQRSNIELKPTNMYLISIRTIFRFFHFHLFWWL